jgi:hypothetical protein
MNQSSSFLPAAAALTIALAVAPAFAGVIPYAAQLTAAAEVPPVDSAASGAVQGTYDSGTKTLTWTITYQGLSGDVTGAQFHGPAKPGATADATVAITSPYASPIQGSAAISDQQFRDLRRGAWYLSVVTTKYPDGEIRGQLGVVRP